MGFTNSDYAGDLDDRKSTSDHVFMMGMGAVSWSSKKQQVISLSTTEAEFIVGASCACQAVWLRRRMLEELNCPQLESTPVYCDNSSTIKLSRNLVLYGRSKHIDVRHHFLLDLTKDGTIDLVFCESENHIVDILTKPLKLAMFERL